VLLFSIVVYAIMNTSVAARSGMATIFLFTGYSLLTR
jgi:hypothetical protein